MLLLIFAAFADIMLALMPTLMLLAHMLILRVRYTRHAAMPRQPDAPFLMLLIAATPFAHHAAAMEMLLPHDATPLLRLLRLRPFDAAVCCASRCFAFRCRHAATLLRPRYAVSALPRHAQRRAPAIQAHMLRKILRRRCH